MAKDEEKVSEFTIHQIIVKSWRRDTKYPCPNCSNKLGLPEYTCDPCKIKLKIKVQF